MNNKSIVRRIIAGLTALLMITCALVVFVHVRVTTLGNLAEEMRSTTIPSLIHLATVQRVAEEAEGFVEVESVPRQGTTFHLYLPVVQEQLAPVAASEPAALTLGKGRVLVVDDQDLLRDFTQKFLHMTGLNVLVASGGRQALQVLEESAEPVDLLFTDYNMPGMTGVELIEQVAKRWPDTKFVLASGFLKDAAYASIEPYNVSILAKPYDMADASKIVMEKLAEKKAAAPATLAKN